METKTYQAKKLVAAGEFVKAAKIVKSFKAIFSSDECSLLTRFYEISTGKDKFYKSLGFNIEQIQNEAKLLLKTKLII